MVSDAAVPFPDSTQTECIQAADHSGHRNRMQKRYAETGLAGFKEHEVLEMLLFRSIPRSNTNPLAHEMLDACGSVETVLEKAEELTIPGVGEKTVEMLRETREALETCFRHMLTEAAPLDRWQFYTAAVWFLRRYPERILLVVCDSAGKLTELGTIGNAEPAAILENLHCFVQPDTLCHIACMGREAELARLRKCSYGVRVGMFLSLSERWVPAWL